MLPWAPLALLHARVVKRHNAGVVRVAGKQLGSSPNGSTQIRYRPRPCILRPKTSGLTLLVLTTRGPEYTPPWLDRTVVTALPLEPPPGGRQSPLGSGAA
jgi:hypothetical protein